jgi:hypothetical protein
MMYLARYISYSVIKNMVYSGYEVIDNNPNTFLVASGSFIIASGMIISSVYPVFSTMVVLGSVVGTGVGVTMTVMDCNCAIIDGVTTGMATGSFIGMSIATIATILPPSLAGFFIGAIEGSLSGAYVGHLCGSNIWMPAVAGGLILAALGHAYCSAHSERIIEMIWDKTNTVDVMANAIADAVSKAILNVTTNIHTLGNITIDAIANNTSNTTQNVTTDDYILGNITNNNTEEVIA